MIKRDVRGLSSVVSLALIILGTIIGAALLWAFVLKSTNRSNEVVDPDCLTINLEAVECKAYAACNYFLGLPYYEADILVKRNVGRGNVTGLRFIFEGMFGKKGAYDRNLNGNNLDELQSLRFTEPYGSIPVASGDPYLLRIAALIGKNKDVCPITSNSVSCPNMSSTLNFPLGRRGDSSNRRNSDCCQWPKNTSQCYDGNDPSIINPVTGRLIGALPAGNISVCCVVAP